MAASSLVAPVIWKPQAESLAQPRLASDGEYLFHVVNHFNHSDKHLITKQKMA